MDVHTESTETDLKELARRFRVCWQVWPEYHSDGLERRQIGFELELSGTHEAGVEHPTPGCEHCRHVFVALNRIAEWILPKDVGQSKFEIGPYNRSITYTRQHGDRPDVTLTINALHPHGFEQPVDAAESRSLTEMEARLHALAVVHL